MQAGTYGVLVLFGVMPAAMWSERSRQDAATMIRVVPGGKPMLLSGGSLAAAVVLNEAAKLVAGLST
jgi:hypothetical protein